MVISLTIHELLLFYTPALRIVDRIALLILLLPGSLVLTAISLMQLRAIRPWTKTPQSMAALMLDCIALLGIILGLVEIIIAIKNVGITGF